MEKLNLKTERTRLLGFIAESEKLDLMTDFKTTAKTVVLEQDRLLTLAVEALERIKLDTHFYNEYPTQVMFNALGIAHKDAKETLEQLKGAV